MNTLLIAFTVLFIALVIWAQIARKLIQARFLRGERDSYAFRWLTLQGRTIGSLDLKHVGIWLTPRLSVSFGWDAFSPWMLSYVLRCPAAWVNQFRPSVYNNSTIRERWLVLPRDAYACCPWMVRVHGFTFARYRPGKGFSYEAKPCGLFFTRSPYNRA